MLATAMLAQPPIEQLIAEVSASPESGGQTSDTRPINENPKARMKRLMPAEIF